MKKAFIIILPVVVLFFLGCPPTWKNASKIYIGQREYDKAKEQALIGMKIASEDYEAYCLLGKAELGLGNYPEASKAFQTAFKKDSLATIKWLKTDENGRNLSAYWQVFYNAGYKAFLDKKFDEALLNIKFAQRLDLENVSQYIIEGNVYIDMNEKEKAMAVFRRVLEIDKENAEANYFIAKVHFDRQQYDSCHVYLKNSIKIFE